MIYEIKKPKTEYHGIKCHVNFVKRCLAFSCYQMPSEIYYYYVLLLDI